MTAPTRSLEREESDDDEEDYDSDYDDSGHQYLQDGARENGIQRAGAYRSGPLSKSIMNGVEGRGEA